VNRRLHDPALVQQRALDRLLDPPAGIGAEPVAPAVIEFLGSANQAEVAFLDEVEERDPPALIVPRRGDDQAEVCLDELGLGAVRDAPGALARRERGLERRPLRPGRSTG
jgi:hypothetical protein